LVKRRQTATTGGIVVSSKEERKGPRKEWYIYAKENKEKTKDCCLHPSIQVAFYFILGC
jgi:hypothetical protein